MEDELFISLLVLGGKGVVHTTAGYMVYAEYSFRNVFNMKKMTFIGVLLISDG